MRIKYLENRNLSVETFSKTLKKSIRGLEIYRPVRQWRLDKLTKRPSTYPNWHDLLAGHEKEWSRARENADGTKVLIVTSLGLHFTANTIDTLFGLALTFRGARVQFAYCDGVLPACQMIDHNIVPSVSRTAKSGPQPDFCKVCTNTARRVHKPIGLPIHYYSKYIDDEDDRRATDFAQSVIEKTDSAQTKELVVHAKAGALRFFGREYLDLDKPHVQSIYVRYLKAAWLADAAARKIIMNGNYDVVVAHHGIYVPQGPILEVARETKTRVVTWHSSYRKQHLIYQHNDTYHREMVKEKPSRWNKEVLSPQQDEDLTHYLKSRKIGALDWITFQRRQPETNEEIRKRFNLDKTKPVYLMAANVAWDARLHYPQSAFGSMKEWVVETVRWFIAHPDKYLIVRCHPGEIMSSPVAQDRLDDILAHLFPELPDNIKIVTPEMKANTYALANVSEGILIYNTKLGMELAAVGKPVVVAGDAWIRGKGFSRDATKPEDYKALLDDKKTFLPLSKVETQRARCYAYHFFFRRCVPLSMLEVEGRWPLVSLNKNTVSLSKSGKDKGLDIICNGIMNSTPFEMEHDYEN